MVTGASCFKQKVKKKYPTVYKFIPFHFLVPSTPATVRVDLFVIDAEVIKLTQMG